MAHHTGIYAVLIFLLLGLAGCRDQPEEVADEPTALDLRQGELILCSGQAFGEVQSGFSCRPAVRESFDLAMALLHSFEYDEAEKAFGRVIAEDPECAMAYWGAAMSLYHALWAPPGEAELEKGARILAAARELPATARERDYLEAVGWYFRDWETIDAKTRARDMSAKMREIHERYPEDTEAAIFYALTLNATADPSDKSYRNQREAGRILEALFPDQPNHPGIAHYIIHNYDNPVLAEKALPTARKYADIAPASAHAQHMPSHIFTRLGLWEESIAANLRSTEAAVCYAEGAGLEGHWDEELHGMDYLVYAYLQRGDNRHAEQQNEYLNTFTKLSPVNFKGAYTLAAIPARIALENRDWPAAAGLELSTMDFPWADYPWQRAILHFSRALGAIHLGEREAAEREIATLDSLHTRLAALDDPYQMNQVMIQIKSAQAWLGLARGQRAEALALMEEAATMEDNTAKHPVTPGEVLPARELLGDMLRVLGRPADALRAYEGSLATHPNRFNGLYGAATAADRLGDHDKARRYFAQLVSQTAGTDNQRPEIREAEAFLGRR
ncbi:tetratricopeptide (TPR) repeat protein [Lewinella marina]|uniref:Tetratricopeptide repeat protein n=1 Tax=Neolewinella marina TaxID=438751 RepID=A0A2G0CKH3_9BACT|nr:tetratricopeptide repeat protein [Neolewinella marina]NJB84338.1 tetratricopeptide (TPR) repeat protein [Neolewinella marina]PHL00462.1 hypothetical protein CGL56_05370 [Neolewinella marina]